MKALVATGLTQGARRSDINECIEGELVWMLEPCPTSAFNPDGACGCGRSFSGMNSHGSTTTARVRDIPWLTEGNYAAALRSSFDALGWCSCCSRRPVPELVDALIRLAAPWPEGAIIERRLDELVLRAQVESDVEPDARGA